MLFKMNLTQLGTHLSKRYITPPRTPRISGLKSQVLKPTFWLKNDDEKWSRIFHFEIPLAQVQKNLP